MKEKNILTDEEVEDILGDKSEEKIYRQLKGKSIIDLMQLAAKAAVDKISKPTAVGSCQICGCDSPRDAPCRKVKNKKCCKDYPTCTHNEASYY